MAKTVPEWTANSLVQLRERLQKANDETARLAAHNTRLLAKVKELQQALAAKPLNERNWEDWSAEEVAGMLDYCADNMGRHCEDCVLNTCADCTTNIKRAASKALRSFLNAAD